MENIIAGYVECMRWANTYGYNHKGEIESVEASAAPLTDAVLREAREDVSDFYSMAMENAQGEFETYFREHGPEHFGHDFALSRNGHGAGFFDRGQGYPELQKLAKTYGTRSWLFRCEIEGLE